MAAGEKIMKNTFPSLSPGQSGTTAFEIAIMIAIIVILAAVAVPTFLERNSHDTKKWAGMRTLATALESYYLEHESYPAMQPIRPFSRKLKILIKAEGYHLNTIETGRPGLAGITTPVAHCKELIPDPLAPEKTLPYVYHTDEYGWILISAGPDGDYDLNPVQDYDGSIAQPSLHLLTGAATFDPTNGMRSNGDIWRVSQ